MRRVLFIALAVLFACGTAYAQINEGISDAYGKTFVFGLQGQVAGGSVNAGVHYPLTYAYAFGIGGRGELSTPIEDIAGIHDWEGLDEVNGFLEDWEDPSISGQEAFLMGIANPEADPQDPQVSAAGAFSGEQGQEQVNVAHAGAESVNAETYMGMKQTVIGAAFDEGYANAFAYGFNNPQEEVFAGAVTVGIDDPTNAGAALVGFRLGTGRDGGIAVGAGAVAEDPGLMQYDEEQEKDVYVVLPDSAAATSESWVGGVASYTNTVNSDVFQSINMGLTLSEVSVYAKAAATGLSGDDANVMYATIFDPDVEAFSAGGIAIQADSDALGFAGGTIMSAGINDAYWSTEGEFDAGNGSMVGIDVKQVSAFYAEAVKTTNTGYQTGFQEFTASQSISFQAKDGSKNLPDDFPGPPGPICGGQCGD